MHLYCINNVGGVSGHGAGADMDGMYLDMVAAEKTKKTGCFPGQLDHGQAPCRSTLGR